MADERDGSARRGLLFDELVPGAVYRSAARTVTEADVVAFAGLSGDFNPLHTDEEFAARTPFRGRIAHGLLVQSIASGLANQTGIFDGTLAALTEMVIRYRAPVRFGDTVRVALEVRDKEPEPGPRRGWARFGIQVLNHRGELVSEGEWLTLMHRRRPSPRAD
jgi:acyl dehydratase